MASASTYNDALSLIGDVQAPAGPTPDQQSQKQRSMVAAQGFQPQPMTARFGQQGNQAQLNQTREQQFVAENRDVGVPLDVQSGADTGTRAQMSFERVPEKKVEWLSKQPGIEGARLAKDGSSVIIRVKSEDGTPRDILVDERRTTLKDLADITGDLPQIAASAITAFFTGGMGLVPQALAQAGVSAGVGAAQDAVVRAGTGRDVDPGEIAASRGMGAAFDAGLPLAPAGAKRLLQAAVGPFAKGVGPLEIAAKEAGKRLNVPLSASQLTGNKALARVETFTENLPFGTPLVEQRKAQDNAINKVREYLLGGPVDSIPSNQEISERVGGSIELQKGEASRNMATKRMARESESAQSINALLEQNIPGGAVTPSQAGSAARSAIVKQRDQFKQQANTAYQKVYDLAGDASFVPTTPIRDLVKDIEEKSIEATQKLLPEIKRIFSVGSSMVKTEKLAPILDSSGRTMGAAEIEIPQKMTLKQAIELRSVIGDMVGRPEALAGIPTGYMKRLYGAASEAIEQGVKAAPNPEVAKALGDAQKLYKDNFWKFEQPGVAELFAESAPGKGFKIGDSDVARRITAGGGDVDQLGVYRSMLGKDSKEYKGLLRSSLNEMIQDASFGENVVDAGQFLGRLKSMSPEFRKEALGPIEKELVGEAKVLELLQGRKVEPLEMERILNARPGKVADTVREIVSEQTELDKAYGSNLMRQLTDGRFDPTRLNADEFVNRFVSTASASELRQTMTMLRTLDPEIPDMIRKRATADLLTKVSGPIKPESAVAGEIGGFDFRALMENLGGTSGEKYRTLLGAEVMDTLKDLTTIEAAREKSASMGKQSGQLVYSNILAALMDFRFSEVPRIAKNRVLAGLLTTPGLKTWLTSQAKIPATPATRRAIMSSPPVIRSILEEFSDEPDLAGQVIDAIKESPDAQEPAPPTTRDLIDTLQVAPKKQVRLPSGKKVNIKVV